MGYPMLDPEHDLKGATPEKLARALLRPRHPRTAQPSVVRERESEYVAGEEPDAAAEKAGRARSI